MTSTRVLTVLRDVTAARMCMPEGVSATCCR